jgi:outer membrane protein assembly factor BamB
VFIQTAIATASTPPGPATAPAAASGGGGGRRGGGGAFGGSVEKPSGPVQFVLLCLDRRTGQTRWQKVLRDEVPHEGHHKEHGFASYSPVTDGKHVYAYFGSRGLHCLDFNGNLKWSKDLGKLQMRNAFGEGSSPALLGDTIVIKWDHEGTDFIAAFDKTSGEERWRTPRDENTNWSTPLIVENDGKAQVVTTATGRVRSYDLADGKQIWEAPGLTANAIPTPVAGNGMVYVTSGFGGSSLYAVKLGADTRGDLTGTNSIAWSAKKGTPYVPSPLLYGDRLYLFSVNTAILSCFDANTGKALIDTQRIDDLENVYSSPVAAAGRVYLVGRSGATVVIKNLTGDSNKLEVLATNQLEEKFDASPAVAGKELFLRGQENLYCIAAP